MTDRRVDDWMKGAHCMLGVYNRQVETDPEVETKEENYNCDQNRRLQRN
jgi:hypothetical protein